MGISRNFFVYFPFVILLVAFAAFVLRCRFRVRVQAIWAIVLLTCFSKFLCYREFAGDAFTPELPERVIWLWNWAYSGACILAALAVLTVCFRIPKRAYVLPLLAWGLAAWGLWNGIAVPEAKEVELAYADLPAALDGYRIVQLSDLHVSSAARRWRTERIVERANACGGDLIVLTGDLVDGLPRERQRDVMPLKNLKARDGVYAVTGNHEVYFDAAEWMPLYERWGLKFLHNECVFPHEGLALGGTDERAMPKLHRGKDYKSVCPNVAWTFSAATNGEFRVFLQHRPENARENIRRHGVRLQLSGHTHGGVMPPMRRIVTKHNCGFLRGVYDFQTPKPPNAQTSKLPNFQTTKLSNAQTSRLYVSSGAGQWAGFPMRFFTPTEITVITLRRKADERP